MAIDDSLLTQTSVTTVGDPEGDIDQLIEMFTCTDGLTFVIKRLHNGQTPYHQLRVGRSFPKSSAIKWLFTLESDRGDRIEAIAGLKESFLEMRTFTALELESLDQMMTVHCPFIEVAFERLKREDGFLMATDAVTLH